MALLTPSATKFNFDGIGSASAAAVMALLASNPGTAWLTVGLIPGKVVAYILTKIFGSMASEGVVILNVGADKLIVASQKSTFDGTMDSSYKLIDQLTATGATLTAAQTKAIDDAVIIQFRKFGKLGGKQ